MMKKIDNDILTQPSYNRRTILKIFALPFIAGVTPILPSKSEAFWPLILRGSAFLIRVAARSATKKAVRQAIRRNTTRTSNSSLTSIGNRINNSLDIIDTALNIYDIASLNSDKHHTTETYANISGQLYDCETASRNVPLEVYDGRDPWLLSSQPDYKLHEDICQAMGADENLVNLARKANAHAIWVASKPGQIHLELENLGQTSVATGDIHIMLLDLTQGKVSQQVEREEVISSIKLQPGITPKHTEISGNITVGIKQVQIVNQGRTAIVGNILVV